EPDRGREADLRRRPRSDQEREARRGEKEKHEPENRAAGAEAERVEAEAGERRNRENGDRQRLLRIANAVERRQRAQPRSGRARGRDEERENREGAEEEGERAPPRLEESRQGDGERERTDPDGGNPVRRGGARVDEGRDERRQYERAGLPFDRRQGAPRGERENRGDEDRRRGPLRTSRHRLEADQQSEEEPGAAGRKARPREHRDRGKVRPGTEVVPERGQRRREPRACEDGGREEASGVRHPLLFREPVHSPGRDGEVEEEEQNRG